MKMPSRPLDSSAESQPIVETERLILREFVPADEVALRAIFCDPDVMHFGDGPRSPGWIRGWLDQCLQNYFQNAGARPWAVVKKGSHQLIGYCGLFDYPDVNGRAEIEIGYRLARPHWGRGLATEAVCAARDYAFAELGVTRLIALIDPQNTASIRVAMKAGMKYESDVLLDGYTHADHVYVLSDPGG